MQIKIREAVSGDAEQLIRYVQRLSEEPGITIPLAPGEFQITIEEEERILDDFATADNSIYLVAERDEQIVGILNCNGGKRQANRHNASFGMSVAREVRNRGVGTALLQYLLAWAKDSPVLSRLELEVYAHNDPAIHLYQKFGFVQEGRRCRAYFQGDRFIDGIIMALFL